MKNFCLVMPLHNSDKTIEAPFKNLNLILNSIEEKLELRPFFIFIDDFSNQESFTKTKDFILEKLNKYKKNILFLRNTKNIGVFPNLNKAINILLLKEYIKPTMPIDFVIMRDSDDYITSETINLLKDLKDGYSVVPRVKLEVTRHEIKDFFEISSQVASLEELEKSEREYFSLKCSAMNRDRLYFSDPKDNIENSKKAILINNLPYYVFEFYELFYVYALAGFNLNYFKTFGGFELQDLDASGKKALNVDFLKILNYLLSNFLTKIENVPMFNKENESYKFLSNIVNNLKIKFTVKQEKIYNAENQLKIINGFDYPAIFRVTSSNSLSSNNLTTREFFHFNACDKFINLKRDLFDVLKIIKSSQSILNKNNYEDILKKIDVLTSYILQKFYVPLITENCQEIVHQGDNWIFHE